MITPGYKSVFFNGFFRWAWPELLISWTQLYGSIPGLFLFIDLDPMINYSSLKKGLSEKSIFSKDPPR